MAEENVSDVKEVENCFNAKEEECISKINELPKPQSTNLRRYSTSTTTKPQVKSRYRANHRVNSTHDFCKYGNKRCDQDDNAVKPWNVARRKSVEASEIVKVERRKSLGSVIPVNKTECSVDGSNVKSNEKARKKKKRETLNILSGSVLVNKVHGLTATEKVSRISYGESYEVCAPKNQMISGEDVKEKTVRVVECSIKSEKHSSTIRSGHNNILTRSSAYHSPTNPIPEKKIIRPKREGVKVTSFKKGKVLEPKHEDSSPTWIKFRKRVVQEQKRKTEVRKKNLKAIGLETKTDSCEGGGGECEKVSLRHRNVEEKKKKMMRLFNHVIEETMSKFTNKDKVKALIGAFETVISLQDTKTSHKVQCKTTTSASKV